ncbi:hypothetical protein [Ensifer sp. R-19]|uniref:hypothetical protein n=1 Tax=Ensifer sp. R-19 TaxID=3404055 RepID=UPI003CF1E408
MASLDISASDPLSHPIRAIARPQLMEIHVLAGIPSLGNPGEKLSSLNDIRQRLDVFVSVQKQQGRGILVEVRRRLTLFHCSAAVDRTTGSRNWRGKAAPVLDGTEHGGLLRDP